MSGSRSLSASLSPSTLSRHRQNWQRKCRRCVTRIKDAAYRWSEAQSEGLGAANALVNDVVLLKTVSHSQAVETLSTKVRGVKQASVAKLKQRAQRYAKQVGEAFESLAEALDLMRQGKQALLEEDSLGIDASMVKRLQREQPVFWTVCPNVYLKKMENVLSCYERELAAKQHVLRFLLKVAEDFQKEDFESSETLENKLKVHLVVWMLEPEIDVGSVQELEDLYSIENKLCKRY